MSRHRGLLFVFCGLLAATAAAQGPNPELRQAHERAQAAHRAKDYPAFLTHSLRVAELAPRSMRALYNLACAHALAGNPGEATSLLDRLAGMGVAFDLAADED